MKKIFSFFLATLLLFLALPQNVYAVAINDVTGLGSIGDLISDISGLVVPFAVLGFIGSVLYAGYTRMFALGDPEKEKKSMKIAVGAAIGFAIIALAPLIVKIAGSLLKVDSNII